MSKSILTLTVNPALDRIVTVDRIVFEDRAYIESTTEAAGGRGINASRVLTSFGATNTAVTTSGKEVGRKFEEQLRQEAMELEYHRPELRALPSRSHICPCAVNSAPGLKVISNTSEERRKLSTFQSSPA